MSKHAFDNALAVAKGQFRPGQMVRVITPYGSIGTVEEIGAMGDTVIVRVGGDLRFFWTCEVWPLLPSEEPGITGHLHPSRSERFPAWVATREWRR